MQGRRWATCGSTTPSTGPIGTATSRGTPTSGPWWARRSRLFYAAEFARTGGRQQNVFEEWAGLHDGGYLR